VSARARDDTDAGQIHAYLMLRLGHKWRFETWRKKYEARLRVYGAEKCRIAVDGFCSGTWWVANHGHNAPDLIFRSDRSFERFLAMGLKLPRHSEEEREKRATAAAQRDRRTEYRRELEAKNAELTRRFHAKIAGLKDELQENTWEMFIAPLLYVGYEDGVVVLFHETAGWVQDCYSGKIERGLGKKVKIVSEPMKDYPPVLRTSPLDEGGHKKKY